MSYADAVTAIAEELDTLITPESLLRYVYRVPAGSLETLPSVVFFGNGGRFGFTFGNTVEDEQHHEEFLKILVKNSDIEEGMRDLELIRSDVMSKIRSVGDLNGHGEIYHVEWSPPSRHTYAKDYYLGQAIRIQFLVKSVT